MRPTYLQLPDTTIGDAGISQRLIIDPATDAEVEQVRLTCKSPSLIVTAVRLVRYPAAGDPGDAKGATLTSDEMNAIWETQKNGLEDLRKNHDPDSHYQIEHDQGTARLFLVSDPFLFSSTRG